MNDRVEQLCSGQSVYVTLPGNRLSCLRNTTNGTCARIAVGAVEYICSVNIRDRMKVGLRRYNEKGRELCYIIIHIDRVHSNKC